MNQLLLIALLSMATPGAAQSIRRGTDLPASQWAVDHSILRCQGYGNGSSWGDALSTADIEMLNRPGYRETRDNYSASSFQQALDSAAARQCRAAHLEAWQEFTGEVAP